MTFETNDLKALRFRKRRAFKAVELKHRRFQHGVINLMCSTCTSALTQQHTPVHYTNTVNLMCSTCTSTFTEVRVPVTLENSQHRDVHHEPEDRAWGSLIPSFL